MPINEMCTYFTPSLLFSWCKLIHIADITNTLYSWATRPRVPGACCDLEAEMLEPSMNPRAAFQLGCYQMILFFQGVSSDGRNAPESTRVALFNGSGELRSEEVVLSQEPSYSCVSWSLAAGWVEVITHVTFIRNPSARHEHHWQNDVMLIVAAEQCSDENLGLPSCSLTHKAHPITSATAQS